MVGDGDAVFVEAVAGGDGFGGEFAGVVELGLDPEALAGGKAVDEGGGPAHGEDNGCAGAEADGIELGELGEGVDPGADFVVAAEHGVAAGEEDFAHGGACFYGGEEVVECGGGGVLEEAFAGAMAAIGRAGHIDHCEEAVGESLLDAGGEGGGGTFAKGVGGIAVVEALAGVGEELAKNGVVGIGPIGKGGVVGGNAHREGAGGGMSDGVGALPLPIIPVVWRDGGLVYGAFHCRGLSGVGC